MSTIVWVTLSALILIVIVISELDERKSKRK
ncbi:Uncharacterised protein [Listeria fleischmannii subsp. fleischmannii]|uniref:Uncharacterized protein n=1 Tax=Listeria fleischmannii subsp. fleischmannii TaxID=1671902 RepID=A0A2X3JGF3_9LIST|nr:Uncharacterised protein [Listeria fleischmannii subsp. fleischmannii]